MPKIVDHQAYRQELLTQCFDLFAQKGYGSITMRQIAKGLGVSTGTLYHYFPSKERIFEQLVEYLSTRDTSEEWRPKLEEQLTLKAKVEALMDFVAQNKDYITNCILMVMDYIKQQDHQAVLDNPVIQRSMARYETAIANCLGLEDPDLTILVISWVDGVLLRRLLTGEKVSFEAQGQRFGQMLDAYLRQHAQPKE